MKKSFAMVLVMLVLALTSTNLTTNAQPPINGKCSAGYYLQQGECLEGEIPIGNRNAGETESPSIFWSVYDFIKFIRLS